MKVTIPQLRLLFTAIMSGTPSSALPFIAEPFRNLDFNVEITEDSRRKNGRLISVSIYHLEDPSDRNSHRFLLQAWYQETPPNSAIQWPFKDMCFNRTFGQAQLDKIGEFMVYDAANVCDSAETPPTEMWNVPVRNVGGVAMGLAHAAHINPLFNHPPLFQQPGFFPNPGFPGFQPQQPNWQQPHHPGYQRPVHPQPAMDQVYHNTVTNLYANQRRKLRDRWIDENCSALRGQLTDVLRELHEPTTKIGPVSYTRGDLDLHGIGIQRLFDTTATPGDINVLRRLFEESLKDSGVQIDLQWSTRKDTVKLQFTVLVG